VHDGYGRTLSIALDHSLLVLLTVFGAVALNVWLIVIIPKSFFPEQDTGRMVASLVADQSGGGASSQTNTGSVYVALKPLSERDGVEKVMARLRRKLAQVPGGRLYLSAVQDIRIGGRSGNAEYQYTILGDDTAEVYAWGPKLLAAVQNDPALADVSSDQQQRGLETYITVDRDTASRLGLTMYQVDNTLYDAFGQRSVSTIYSALNQITWSWRLRRGIFSSGGVETILGQHLRGASERFANDPNERRLGDGRFAVGGRDRFRRVDAGGLAIALDCDGFGGQPDICGIQQCGAADQQCGVARRDERQLQLRRHVQRGRQQCGAHRGAGHDYDDRERKRVERVCGFDIGRDDDAASGFHPVRSGRHAACGQSPEPFRGDENLFQSRARKVAQRRNSRVSARSAGHPSAERPLRRLRRRRARI